jgi:hypothetical protein
VNNDADPFPRLSASFTAPTTSITSVNDGNFRYTQHPPNRWTTMGSPNRTDTLDIDFGTQRLVDTIKLAILDDGKDVLAPKNVTFQYHDGKAWRSWMPKKATPPKPAGHRFNAFVFQAKSMRKIRVVFTHADGGFTGLSEIEAWGPGKLPYVPAPASPGNLALNPLRTGYPIATASFSDVYGGIPVLAIDGRINYEGTPVNRWTSYGSPNKTDWLEVDFGTPKEVRHAILHIYDDRGGVQAPESYIIQFFDGSQWLDVQNLIELPAKLEARKPNHARFAPVKTSKIRVVFTHSGGARSGLTELELRND